MLGNRLYLPQSTFRGGVGDNALNDYGTPFFLADFGLSQFRNNGPIVPAFTSLSGLTFTRASAGYAQTSAGVLTSFASGVPRITDKGLLIEGARTNLCTYSQDLTNAAWTNNIGGTGINPTTTGDYATAPDGTVTADRLQCNLGGGTTSTDSSRKQISITGVTSGVSCVITFYAKLNAGGSSATINTQCTAGLGGTFQAITDQWARYSFVFTSTATSGSFLIGLRGGNSCPDTIDMSIWGVQFENNVAFPSSYIPTTTASATRPADVASIAVSGLVYPLTMFAEFERVVDTATFEEIISINTGSTNDRAEMYVGTTDLATANMVSGGAAQGTVTVAGALAIGTVYRAAARFNTNSIQIAKLGTLGTEDTTATLPTNPSQVHLGRPGTATQSFGYIRRAALWSGAFTDANLQALST